jgi:hypothetical protein
MRASVMGICSNSRRGHPSGCRCPPCRIVKADYERNRKAAVKVFGPGIVPTEKAMRHLKLLRHYEVGLQAVSAATKHHREIPPCYSQRRSGHDQQQERGAHSCC